MTPAARSGAIVAGAVGVLTTSILVWALHGERLRERWHLARLASPERATRADAASTLGELRSERAVRVLLAELEASGEDADQSAADALVAMGPFVASRVASFAADESRPLFARLAALGVIQDLGADAASVSGDLETILDPYLVPAVTEALEAMGDSGLPALIRLLASDRIDTRYHAASALARRFPEGRLELRALASDLEGESPPERRRRSRELLAWLAERAGGDGTEEPPGRDD